MSQKNVVKRLKTSAQKVDKALKGVLPEKIFPAHLAQAMRYSVFSGGKRVRPFLVLESSKVFGLSEAKAMPLACTMEMIHAYSLVHDDLPAMDDDDERRGRKTCHRKYDEATAILTGDALLTQAFQVLAEASIKPDLMRRVTKVVSVAAGPQGMVGGQAADLRQGKAPGLKRLKQINALKTGALITACTEGGAIWAGADAKGINRLKRYGVLVGELFQLVDDILDGDGYARIAGKEKTYRKAVEVRDEAKSQLKIFGKKAQTLNEFTDFLLDRKY